MGIAGNFSSYSFSSGAARRPFIPLIHALGRWASNEYRHYIRTLPDIFSRAMADL
jgi:hypothetical protein